MKILIFLALSILLLTSCATLMNRPYEPITIATSEPARVVIEDDTLSRLSNRHYRMVERSWDSLKVVAFNSHASKTIKVKSGNSAAYEAALYLSILWPGFLFGNEKQTL